MKSRFEILMVATLIVALVVGPVLWTFERGGVVQGIDRNVHRILAEPASRKGSGGDNSGTSGVPENQHGPQLASFTGVGDHGSFAVERECFAPMNDK
jgi:hypothetical protein